LQLIWLRAEGKGTGVIGLFVYLCSWVSLCAVQWWSAEVLARHQDSNHPEAAVIRPWDSC